MLEESRSKYCSKECIRMRNSRAQKLRRLDRKKNNMCTVCGKANDTYGVKCSKCALADRNSHKKKPKNGESSSSSSKKKKRSKVS